MNKFTITLGADPEFFVMEKKNYNHIVPSCRLFGGEKGSPMFLSPDGGYLEDGTTVEFNVTPCKTLVNVRTKIANLLLVFLNKYDKYHISPHSSCSFSQSVLDQFPEARNIGCSPDMFAYGLRIAPSITKFQNQRFAGGHIHVGIDPWPEGLEKETFVKYLDLLFSAPFAWKWGDPSRWPFYGHFGLYRETKYGVEYRSPDNFWCNPAWFVENSREREKFEELMSNFDMSIERLKVVLDFDGHGARLNHDIKNFVKASELEKIMTSVDVFKDPGKVANFRGYGVELFQQTKRWESERLAIMKNREKLPRQASGE